MSVSIDEMCTAKARFLEMAGSVRFDDDDRSQVVGLISPEVGRVAIPEVGSPR